VIEVEWDPAKERVDQHRHGLSFDDATSAFSDDHSLTIRDTEHSVGEKRFVTMGHSYLGRLIVVCHTDRGDSMRIVSATRASPRERRQYESQG
jgi:uncharacterized DUF497 family protein